MHYVECLLLSYFFRFACFSVSARWNTIEMALKRKSRFSSKCLLLELFNWALSCSFERDGAIGTLGGSNITEYNDLKWNSLTVTSVGRKNRCLRKILLVRILYTRIVMCLKTLKKIIVNVLFTAPYRGYGIHWIICQFKSITVSDSWKFLFLYSQF